MDDVEIPEMHLFMMCRSLNRAAMRPLPDGFSFRYCREDELDLWMAMPFDDPDEATEYKDFMKDFFDRVYAPSGDLFYRTCLFACDENDRPIATAFLWTILGDVTTFHWLKVEPGFEDKGIGRAIISRVMGDLPTSAYPVFLHTHPSSFRAIKLYSDMGFELLSEPHIGTRKNDLDESRPILERVMPRRAFQSLKISSAPGPFLERIKAEVEPEF